MTINEWVKKKLIEKTGLLPDEVDKILDLMSDDMTMKVFNCRWHDLTDDYPPHVLKTILSSAERYASFWTEQHLT